MRLQLQKKHIPVLILAFFGVLLSFIGIYNHYAYKTFTYDYANYNFAFWDYSHFRISPLTTFRGTFLQDHFSFTLMYFIPVFWLLNWLTGTYTLILIQNALILTAAWYSYKIIKLKTENKWLTSGVLLYFFLLFGRYSSFGTDVNLAIMSACFIPIFLYYFEIKKYFIAFIILILSLFSRENIPLWFIFIFIVLIITHRKDKKAVIYSVSGIIISLVYFILLFRVLIPHIETPGVEYKLFNYTALGKDPGEALSFMLNHPIESVKLFFINHSNNPEYDKVKLEFYWVYLVSGGFVLLSRPKYIIWFIPIVAQKVLNDDFFRWGIATYYSVEVVTLLPVAVFQALASYKSNKLQNILVVIVCIASLGMTIHKMDKSNNQIPWTLYDQKFKFYDKKFYETPFNVKAVNKLIKRIPGDAKVSSSNLITPHIAQRQFIYFFPTVNDAEYIVFSLFDDNYLMSAEENEKQREKYLNSREWKIIAKEYPVFLLKKRATPLSGQLSPESMCNTTDTLTCNFSLTDEHKGHILFSDQTKADTISHLTKSIFRSNSNAICLTAIDKYSHGIKINDIESIEQIEISVWVQGSLNNAYIVLDSKTGYYQSSNTIKETEDKGWNKIILTCRLPLHQKLDNTIIYLMNTGSKPIYFDDLQIIKSTFKQ